ncbi:MAG: hypothetical protein AAGN66_17260 [Acidobacteriota bacterium]
MTPEERQFLREFYRALDFGPLEPADPKRVPLYEGDDVSDTDPVELLARAIEWSLEPTVQLLSGFRGTGKSTELLRLQRRLQGSGFLVVLFDIEKYVNLTTPIEVSDFLMALAGAVGEQMKEPELLGKDATREGYWERFSHFLTETRVEFEDLKGKLGPVELKAALKDDPSFKQRLQKRMVGHVASLKNHVYGYLEDCVRQLQKKHGETTDVVLLVDSMEHIRGTYGNEDDVHRSVENLFCSHADKLHLPNLHVVYTIPPFLKVRYPNLSSLYTPGGVQVLPAVKLYEDHDERTRRDAGFDAMARVVAGRGDWEKLLGDRGVLDRLIEASGGHLRDLLRLLAEVVRRAEQLPVLKRTVDAAIDQIRNEFLPVADADAAWLARIAESRRASLRDKELLGDFARFLDTHTVLCYRNGHEWYDVHPLVRDVVLEQAAALDADGDDGAP